MRDYFAAHVDITKFNLWDCVFEMRSMHATYTAEEPTVDEIVAAIAHLKFKVADAMLRTRGEK